MTNVRSLLCFLLFGLGACHPKGDAPAAAAGSPVAVAAPAAPGPGHFGEALSTAPAIPAGEVLSDPARFDGKRIKVSGQVGAVCQRKGCWMTLGTGQPGEPTVRVTFKDYGFFVPTDSLGRTAVVEGQFARRTLPVAEAQHYADDEAARGGNQPPQKISGPQPTLALLASGVELH